MPLTLHRGKSRGKKKTKHVFRNRRTKSSNYKSRSCPIALGHWHWPPTVKYFECSTKTTKRKSDGSLNIPRQQKARGKSVTPFSPNGGKLRSL
ncbi:hypothetical protein WN943_002490 [Citrus x changshan-huyou]